MCCRFYPSPLTIKFFAILTADHIRFGNSPWLWYLVCLSGNCHHCWSPRLGRIRSFLCTSLDGVWVSGPNYQEKMPRGFRSDRMDQAKIWHYNCFVFEFSDVGLLFVGLVLSSPCSNPLPRLITLFLYMVAELSALQSIVNSLTGLNGLPVVIVQCAVTTIYTCKSMCCVVSFSSAKTFL